MTLAWRSLLFCLSAALLCYTCFSWASIESFWHAPHQRSLLFLLQGLCLIVLWLCFPIPAHQHKKSILLILLLALITRLLLLPAPASDDSYRYLWEGKLLQQNISPYRYPADHSAYQAYRDHNWEHMNHKDAYTIYPPLVQGYFALLTLIHYSIHSLKIGFLLFDLATLLLLLHTLRRLHLPLHWALGYAVNPVVLIAVAAESHYDAIFAFFLFASAWCLQQKSYRLAWTCLALATQTKWISLLLLPWFLRHTPAPQRLRHSALASLIILLPCLWFYADLPYIVEGFWNFGAQRSFNGPIHSLLLHLSGNRSLATASSVLLFGATCLWQWRQRHQPLATLYSLLAGLLIFSPTVHFWYLLWIIPFFCLQPSLAWLLLCLGCAGYFQTWAQWQDTGHWGLPPLISLAMWLPGLTLLLYELRNLRWSKKTHPSSKAEATRISLILPTYQAASHLAPCLHSILQSPQAPEEIIIVDGGSTDDTLAIAQQFPVRTLSSAPGRGTQIQHGVRQAQHNTIVIMHADMVWPATSSPWITLRQHLHANPQVIGGCFGQRFDQPQWLFIEALNEMRATFKGTSFGDQVQFFRQSAAHHWQDFPDLPLMEDVALSLAMQQTGPTSYLSHPITVSARKWQEQGFLRRFSLVIRLLIRYRLAQIFGQSNTQALWQEYYQKK